MRKIINTVTVILFSVCSFFMINIAISGNSIIGNFTTLVVYAADDQDFNDDNDKADEWAERENENWERTSLQQETLQEYLSDKDGLASNMESYTLTPVEMFSDKNPELAEKYSQLENSFSNAKLSSGLYCYKDLNTSNIGLVGNANNENFQNQFVGKNIKLTDYYDAKLTNSNLERDSNLILKLKIPSREGSDFKPQAGIEKDQNGKYHVLVNNIYNIHIDNSREEVIKGKHVIVADCSLVDNLDFKNSLKNAEEWGLKNYKGNADNSDPYKEWAPIRRPDVEYNETQLSIEQENSLNDYLNNGYKEMNTYLRDKNHTENSELEQKITDLSNGLATRPIPDNITLYRWMGFKDLGYTSMPSIETLKNDLITNDKVIEDPAFLSTSAFSGSATFSSPRSIVLRLNVSEGTEGGFPYGGKDSALSINGGEGEVLLNKGQKCEVYRITESVVRGKKKIVIDANLID